jgi:uncharacterized protein DUF3352
MADDGDDIREVDYLDSSQEAPATRAGGRRWGPIIGLTAGALVVAGGAAYGIAQFLGGGASPASAVPDDVFAYLAVDLDPGAGQQVEAYRTMKKFPGLKDELKLSSGDEDLRKAIFEKIADEADCDLSYEDDIDSWLGNSAAMTGWRYKDSPELAVAIAVKDQGAAEKGFQKLDACGSTDSGSGGDASGDLEKATNPGVAFTDGWMVLADDHATAQAFIDAASSGSLADDDDFQSRVDDVGGEGFVTGYVSSGAVDAMLDSMTGTSADGSSTAAGRAGALTTSAGSDGTDLPMSPLDPLGQSRAQLEKYFGDFKGAAMSLRFDSGALEVRVRGEGLPGAASMAGGDSGIEDLPASTAFAYALPVGDTWVSDLVDQMRSSMGADAFDQGVEQFEAQTGLSVPADLQTLLGDGLTVSVDSSIDAQGLASGSPDAISALPVGLRINGDPLNVRPLLDRILAQVPLPPGMVSIENGEHSVAIAPNPDYAKTLAGSGGLGDDTGFTKAVPDFESGDAAVYADFNGSWLTDLVKADGGPDTEKILANLEPLDTMGLSGSAEGGSFDMLLRVTTD